MSTTTATSTEQDQVPGYVGVRSAYHPIAPEIQQSVEQFLYAEAQLLDEHRYLEWISLFTHDVHYWAPARVTRTHRERDREIADEGGAAFIDDDLYYLTGRVRRLTSGVSWSEEPPSRTRRLITNSRVTPGEGGELQVTSNFYVYRSRLERHQDWFVGERFDVLRPADLEATGYPYQIAGRKIVLEQTTLLAPSLSILL